jgi:hypothetical protein
LAAEPVACLAELVSMSYWVIVHCGSVPAIFGRFVVRGSWIDRLGSVYDAIKGSTVSVGANELHVG